MAAGGRSGSRRTAPRRCTCCAPRRATRSSARTPTAPSRRRTSAWAGSSRRRSGLHRQALVRARPDTPRPDRKQLVGLLPVDPDALLPEGAQLVAPTPSSRRSPVPMLGHVTSSYRSAALGRTFALALVKGGRERIGERVLVPLADRVVEAVDRRVRAVRSGEPAPRRGARGMTTTIDAVISETGPMPQVAIRADPADAALLARIGEALAADLPTIPNTVTASTDGQGHVLWLGPDEWLVVGLEGAPAEVAPAIEAALREAAARRVPDDRRRLREPGRHRDRGSWRRGPPRRRLRAGPRASPAGRRLRPDAARPRQRRPVARGRRPGAALPRARPALVRALPCGVASGRARGVTRKGRT